MTARSPVSFLTFLTWYVFCGAYYILPGLCYICVHMSYVLCVHLWIHQDAFDSKQKKLTAN